MIGWIVYKGVSLLPDWQLSGVVLASQASIILSEMNDWTSRDQWIGFSSRQFLHEVLRSISIQKSSHRVRHCNHCFVSWNRQPCPSFTYIIFQHFRNSLILICEGLFDMRSRGGWPAVLLIPSSESRSRNQCKSLSSRVWQDAKGISTLGETLS